MSMRGVVVADSSPLIVLVNLKLIELLPQMFGTVFVPPQVAEELGREARPEAVRLFIAGAPDWLRIQEPKSSQHIPDLHAGEIAAINLALELQPALLLIDEFNGRKAATDRNIPITGTVGLLMLAAEERRIDLALAFERLKQTDFWFSPAKLDELLARFDRRPR
jgi:predicted nucleic acid-binding protein